MAATPSTMLPLGTPAPAFTLPDTVSGKPVSLDDLRRGRRGLVAIFICNHCPYVKHIRAELARIAREYLVKGIGFVAISSNDAERYPADGPLLMKQEAAEAGYTFPYLYDESQSVALAYRAACTPDLYLFDADGYLYYRGQLDASRPKNGLPVTGESLRSALEALLNDRPAPSIQLPSIGCNIKWKPGNEPLAHA